jgi:hypothetical protein
MPTGIDSLPVEVLEKVAAFDDVSAKDGALGDKHISSKLTHARQPSPGCL